MYWRVCACEVEGGAQVKGCCRWSSLALLIPRLLEEQYPFHYTSDLFWFDHTGCVFLGDTCSSIFLSHLSCICQGSVESHFPLEHLVPSPDACKHNSPWWTMCLENSRGEQTKALFHARLSLSPSLSALLTCRWGFIPCLFAQSACGGAYATDFQEIAHCLLLTAVCMLFRAASFSTIGVKIAQWMCPKVEKNLLEKN